MSQAKTCCEHHVQDQTQMLHRRYLKLRLCIYCRSAELKIKDQAVQLDNALVIAPASVLSHDMHARCCTLLWAHVLGAGAQQTTHEAYAEHLTSER